MAVYDISIIGVGRLVGLPPLTRACMFINLIFGL